ncbi:MAG: hypothetical protein JWO87_2392, partial [Phycisphaerales bacterium]|nr:hypothetical protein [Phycisphaerales bacterium]
SSPAGLTWTRRQIFNCPSDDDGNGYRPTKRQYFELFSDN